MHLRPDPTATSSSAAVPLATACGNCGVEERRLLHHVRHRGIYRRLCTSCVLRLHPQSFCPTCFQVYPPPPSNDAVQTCFKCYSSSHSRCVEASPPSPYICPLCLHPNTPIFKLKSATEANAKTGEAKAMNVRIEDCRVMDRDAAKKLLAAAKIASTSMNKAAVAVRAEAERRAKEAAFTRKRAKEALEHVAHLVMKEKSKRKEGPLRGPGFGGIGSNGAYSGPAVREDNVNVSNSNRNGSTASGLPKLNVVEEKLNTPGNVDRDNSNQVLAALNAVELREHEKIGGGITAQGEGSGVSGADDPAPMDVDEKGIISGENATELVEERNNDSSSDQLNPSDTETGAETLNTQAEGLEDVNKEVILVQPVEHQMQQKDISNGEEQHTSGS